MYVHHMNADNYGERCIQLEERTPLKNITNLPMVNLTTPSDGKQGSTSLDSDHVLENYSNFIYFVYDLLFVCLLILQC